MWREKTQDYTQKKGYQNSTPRGTIISVYLAPLGVLFWYPTNPGVLFSHKKAPQGIRDRK